MIDITRNILTILNARVHEPLNFMQALIGPRQVGKTTALQQLAQSWPTSQIFVSADQMAPPTSEWVEFHWQRARELKPPTLLIFDEIQKVKGWETSIKRLFDEDRSQRKLRVILSGSASLSLQSGLTDSLVGRYELIRAPHWSMAECEQAFGWDMATFLKFGGYPAGAELIHDQVRWTAFMRNSIIEPVVSQDLQALVQIQKPALLRQLFTLAMKYPAQEISYQKLLGQLQDRGNAATIKHYLEILAGAFLLSTIEKFSTSGLRQKASSPKIIPSCSALIHAFTGSDQFDQNSEWRGRVFEAAIGARLLQSHGDVFYWREGHDEVDYILSLGNKIFAIEVKSGRKKQGRGLIAFKQKFKEAKTLFVDYKNAPTLLKSQDIDYALEQLSLQ